MVPSISLKVFLWLQQFIIFYFYYTRENIHKQQKYIKNKDFYFSIFGEKNTHKPITQRKLLLSFASHFKLTITTQEPKSALWLAGTPGENPLGPNIINQPQIQTAKCRQCIFSFPCSLFAGRRSRPHSPYGPITLPVSGRVTEQWSPFSTFPTQRPTERQRKSFFYTETHQVLLYPAAGFASPLPASVTG